MLARAVLLALLQILLAKSAQADHSKCSWRPFEDTPLYHQYTMYCVADFKKDGDGRGLWECRDVSPAIKVADYGLLQPGILEWSTPCGDDGFARPACRSSYWALCIGSSCRDNAPCYYMWWRDDCEWPTLFNDSNVPQTIEVWSF